MRARLRAQRLLSGLGILVMGAGGGLALGGFATDGGRSSMAEAAPMLDDGVGPGEVEVATPAIASGPERYSCRGCGPTLADRRAEAYAAQYARADAGYDDAYDLAQDYSPLPAYRPMPYESDERPDHAEYGHY